MTIYECQIGLIRPVTQEIRNYISRAAVLLRLHPASRDHVRP